MSESKTFRGSSLEEVIPKIKADLGPDAEIVRQREGLTGGVGGFFQRACIEVEARPSAALEAAPGAEPSGRRFDAYDDEPAMPEPVEPPVPTVPDAPDPKTAFEPDPLPITDLPTAEGLSSPGIQEILRQAAPFADHLATASRAAEVEASEVLPAPASPAPRSEVGARVEEQLMEAGITPTLAHEIVGEVVTHELPFGAPRRLRKLIRRALARRIPIAPAPATQGRSLAFTGPAGSGKTLCTARLAIAYAAAGDLPVVCVSLQPGDGGTSLRALLEPHGIGVTVAASAALARAHIAGALGHAIVVVDTPSRVDPADIETLGLDEVHLTLPSTYSAAAAAELAQRVPATHVTLTHLDETTRVGGLIDFLIDGSRPLSYFSRGPEGMEPADGLDLAGLVLP